jgi:hypothetical protein
VTNLTHIAALRLLVLGILTLISTSFVWAQDELSTTYTPTVGTEGGNPFELDCGDGSVLAGLNVGYGLNRMDNLDALCVSVNSAGEWLGAPAAAGNIQGGSYSGYGVYDTVDTSTLCPANHAVIGFTGARGNGGEPFSNFAGSVQLRCEPLTSANGQIEVLNQVGFSGEGSATHNCNAGSNARGIYGGVGNHIDYYGLLCATSGNTPPPPSSNLNATGQWGDVIDWPVIAIHSVLTPDGEVLTYGTNDDGVQGAQFYYDIWNPETGIHNLTDNTLGVDSFCSAPLVLPGTKEVFMPGGDARYGEGQNKGIVDAPIINTETYNLSAASDMSYARWYPTSITLPSGEILLAGGIDEAGNASFTPEIYSPLTDSWRSMFGAANYEAFGGLEARWWYPRLWVAPNGLVFGMAGSQAFYTDTAGTGSVELLDSSGMTTGGHMSTAVMYQPGKILQVGGNLGTAGAFVVDINSETPVFRDVPAPEVGSRQSWSNVTVLPNGKVLLTGGGGGDNVLELANYTPELWDPETEEWTQLPNHQLARLYHSSALLLPDGRILMAGGGAPGPIINTNAEIYSPGYLFDELGNEASRPDIVEDLNTYNAGDSISFTYNSDRPLARVTMIKTGAVTHSFNNEQRFIELEYQIEGNQVTTQLPTNAYETPPGYYLLFILDDAGVPSIGKFLDINVATELTVNYTDTVGSLGGASFNLDCGNGSVLAGVNVGYGLNRMDNLDALCVTVNSAGEWLGAPTATGNMQGGSYSGYGAYDTVDASTLCPENQAVIGFTGARGDGDQPFSNFAGSIQLQCQPLISPGTTAGALQTLNQVGYSGEGSATHNCDAGFSARGIYGGVGNHIDYYGLACYSNQ